MDTYNAADLECEVCIYYRTYKIAIRIWHDSILHHTNQIVVHIYNKYTVYSTLVELE